MNSCVFHWWKVMFVWKYIYLFRYKKKLKKIISFFSTSTYVFINNKKKNFLSAKIVLILSWSLQLFPRYIFNISVSRSTLCFSTTNYFDLSGHANITKVIDSLEILRDGNQPICSGTQNAPYNLNYLLYTGSHHLYWLAATTAHMCGCGNGNCFTALSIPEWEVWTHRNKFS